MQNSRDTSLLGAFGPMAHWPKQGIFQKKQHNILDLPIYLSFNEQIHRMVITKTSFF